MADLPAGKRTHNPIALSFSLFLFQPQSPCSHLTHTTPRPFLPSIKLYVDGELVGGLDVIQELKDSGDLKETLAGSSE